MESFDFDSRDPNLPGFPTKEERMKYIACNPVAAAQFFQTYISTVLDTLFRWRDKERPGILGQVQDLVGTVEYQDRGTPHLHALVWIRNMPNPEELKEILEHPMMRAVFLNYLDSCISTSPHWGEAPAKEVQTDEAQGPEVPDVKEAKDETKYEAKETKEAKEAKEANEENEEKVDESEQESTDPATASEPAGESKAPSGVRKRTRSASDQPQVT